MILPDVNVLVDAHRTDAPRHERAARWLEQAVIGAEPVGLADPVVAGFVRVMTHPRIFAVPASLETTLGFVDALFRQPGVVRAGAGRRHWDQFSAMCRSADARGNVVSDAAIAAIAVEHGATVVTFDRDFARFPGLRWELLEWALDGPVSDAAPTLDGT